MDNTGKSNENGKVSKSKLSRHFAGGSRNGSRHHLSKNRKGRVQTSAAYRANEKVVNTLLQANINNWLSDEHSNQENDVGPDEEEAIDSEEFFIHENLSLDTPFTSSNHSSAQKRRQQRKTTKLSEKHGKNHQVTTLKQEEVIEECSSLEADDSSKALTISQSTQRQTPVSVFLQIDEMDLNEDILVYRQIKLYHHFSAKYSDYIYWPNCRNSNSPIGSFCPPLNCCPYKQNIQVMVKRLSVEAKTRRCQFDIRLLNILRQNSDIWLNDEPKKFKQLYCTDPGEKQFKPYFMVSQKIPLEIPDRKVLILSMKELRFTEHPQLREEHRLATNLELMYDYQQQRLSEKISESLYATLQIERRVLNELLQKMSNNSSKDTIKEQNLNKTAVQIKEYKPKDNATAEYFSTQQIDTLMHKIKMLRNKLYSEEATNKKLLKNILNEWTRLKELRQTQGKTYTRLNFHIQIEELNDNEMQERKKWWSKRFTTDLNELHRESLAAYNRQKQIYLQSLCSTKSDCVKIQSKPKKPNLKQLSIQLKEIYARSFCLAQEPRINIVRTLTDDKNFSPVDLFPKIYNYNLRIFFDGKLVATTRTYKLQTDLSLEINEKTCVILNHSLPKNICIKLYRKRRVGGMKKVANIILPLPLPSSDKKITDNPLRLTSVNFSSHNQSIAGYLRLRLYSETEFYSEDMLKTLFPGPQQRIQIPESMLQDWQEKGLVNATVIKINNNEPDDNSKKTQNRLSDTDPEEDNDENDDSDMVQDNNQRKDNDLKKFRTEPDIENCSQSTITCPKNKEKKMKYLQKTQRKTRKKSKLGFCTLEENTLHFCDVGELYENKRWNLLHSRYLQNDARTRDLKLIPMLEKEIITDIWEDQEPVIDVGDWMDPIDVYKHRGKKYLSEFYQTIQYQCQKLNKLSENSDNLLLNNAPVSWKAFFNIFKILLMPRLPSWGFNNMLNFKNSDHLPVLTMGSEHCFKVIFNILRATGIPVRISCNDSNRRLHSQKTVDSTKTQNNPESPNQFVLKNLKYSNVRPFITLSYREQVSRTATTEGSNPTWNEQLILQLSGNLMELKDDIKLSLYDEVFENTFNDDPAIGSADVFQRIQNNWLGEYRIPIRALLEQGRFEGQFELRSPKLIVGYSRPSLDSPDMHSVMLDALPVVKDSTRIWCCISVEPFCEMPKIASKCLKTSELKNIEDYIENWSLDAIDFHRERFLSPLIATSDGKKICLTRLLQPLAPPAKMNFYSICRFVSFISIFRRYDPCLNLTGIWLKNKMLLDIGWSSPKDLGVLLCNYLLYLGLKCWLVLGVAVPHGQTTFVLYETSNESLPETFNFIDPSTGNQYATTDVFCPLQKIRMVVATNNVYLNIQREQRVSMTNFNFKDNSCWWNAFSRRNPSPLAGFHQTNYTYLPSQSTANLLVNIERKVIKKFNAWRPFRKTLWNRAMHPVLFNILQELEEKLLQGKEEINDKKYQQLIQNELPNHQIFGFTMNFAYVNLSQISERIKTTGLHLNTHPDVEFTVAVYIYPFTNNNLSLWIFLLSMIPKLKLKV